MTVTEFLLARIAEDEALARKVADRMEHAPPQEPGGIGNLGIVGYPFTRMLAECEAKRTIIKRYHSWHDAHLETPSDTWNSATSAVLFMAVLDLAAVYAYHPDYIEEWKL